MSRTWLRFSLGFLLMLVIAEVGARALMATSTPSLRWYDHTAALKIDDLDERGDLDVVFAGTSMAWQAFVPQVHEEATGEQGYNVGLAGGTPEVMDRWLTEEVQPRARPSTVVWGLSSLDLAPKYGEENAQAYDTAAETSDGFLNDLDRAVSSVSTLIAERRVLRDPSELWGDGRSERDRQQAEAELYLGPDGERLDFREDVGAETRRIMEARLADFEIDALDVDTIEQTVSGLAEAGIEVVLVELPVSDRFIELHPNGADDHALVGPALSAIAERTDSRFLRLIDGYSDDDFVDFTHLDEAGVARFMSEFEAAYERERDDTGSVALDPVEQPDRPSDECETETIVDEYGFEIEVCVERASNEEDDPVPAGEVPVALEEQDTPVEALVDAILGATLRPCSSNGWDIGGLSLLPADEQATVDHLFKVVEDNATGCELPLSAAELGPVLTDLETLTGRAGPLPKGEPRGSADYSSRIAAAIDELYNHLLPNENARTLMWSHVDEFGASYELARRRTSKNPVKSIAVGSSMTSWQLDQAALDAAYGGGFLNVGQPGLDAEEWERLLETMLEEEDIETMIWATSTHRMINDNDSDECGDGLIRVDEALANRRDLAALTGWEGPGLTGLIGEDPAQSPYLETTIPAGLEERFVDPGDRVVDPAGTRFAAVSSSTMRRYLFPALCERRVRALERVLSAALKRGTEVVLVALPVHPEVIELAPKVHAEADSALKTLAKRLEVPFVRLDALDDDETSDGVHTNETGRTRVTRDLIRRLDALGLT